MKMYIQQLDVARSARTIALVAAIAAGPLMTANAQSNARTWYNGQHPAVTCAKGVASTDVSDAHLLRICRDALALRGNSRSVKSRTLVNTGILEMRRGHSAKAIALFERAQRVDPALPDIRVNVAAAKIRNGEYEAALLTLEDIPTIAEPQRHEAYYNRGLAHWHLGDFEAAYRDFAAAQRLAPEYLPARNMLSNFTFEPVQQTEREDTSASG